MTNATLEQQIVDSTARIVETATNDNDAPIGIQSAQWTRVTVFNSKTINAFKTVAATLPEKMYAVGNLELLDQCRFMAIATAKNTSKESIHIGSRIAEKLASLRCDLVIGGSRPCEAPMINDFLKNNGSVVIILPMGIMNIKNMPISKKALLEGRLLILALSKNDPWSEEIAQLRNDLIVHLAEQLYVPECTSYQSSGTFDLIERFVGAQKRIWMPPLESLRERVQTYLMHYYLKKIYGVRELPMASTASEQIAMTLEEDEEEPEEE